MECAAAIDYSDGYDPPACFQAEDRRAIKAHKCHECYRQIMPGETYRHERGLWDGEWVAHKTCKDCLSIRETMFDAFEWGGLWNDIQAYIDDVRGDVPEACLSSLTPPARGLVCDLIEEQWERWEQYQ